MASARTDSVVRRLGRAVLRPGDAGPTDGQLLTALVDRRDEAAFAALVRRHGPMVLGVCRRVVGHPDDAEDAFQATFLVLARRAPAVRPPDRVGPWLYGVAYRTARKVRATAGRRKLRERQVADMPEPESTPRTRGRTCSRSLTGSSTACPNTTASRSCSATSRGGRSRRPPASSAGRKGRWPAG